MPENYLIIVAGGLGSRMRSELPKQFHKINGKEIIVYSIERFRKYDTNINVIISVHPEYLLFLESLLQKHSIQNIQITTGGNTRFQSVKNGLALITNKNSIVGIHDAARPMVSLNTIKNCYETAAQKGNAIPCIPVVETIRQVNESGNCMADRAVFRVIQTPQCFRTEFIKKAFEQDYRDSFTDDASVLEAAGFKIELVDGNTENIKITNPNDLLIAEAILKHEQ